jgi:peptide/nickel transport system ATP-binding protein
VEDLRVEVEDRGMDIVDDISFTIDAGEVLGLVGESGSGKSTVGLAVLGHTRRGAAISSGAVRIEGRDVLRLSERQRRALRGRTVSYVPQDPASALNPGLRIRTQLEEVLEAHGWGESRLARAARLAQMLDEVLLPKDARDGVRLPPARDRAR